jgi:Protein of unknown function (DUF2796)
VSVPSYLAWLICGLCTAGGVVAAGRPHEHGAVKLDVAIDGGTLTIAMQAPIDNLLGFERTPRNDAERQAAAALLGRLRHPDQAAALFTTDTAAQCVLKQAEVQVAVLEPITKPPANSDHAELEATYEFTCAQPAQLRSLTVGLFDAYPRIERIDVQVAGPTGQIKRQLKRPSRRVSLTR